jgi:hypothetical protein
MVGGLFSNVVYAALLEGFGFNAVTEISQITSATV